MEKKQCGGEHARRDYISRELSPEKSINARVKGRSQHLYVLWGISSTLTLPRQYK
jgi:hypothetical protein